MRIVIMFCPLFDSLSMPDTTDTKLCHDGHDFVFSTEFGKVTPMDSGDNLTPIDDVSYKVVVAVHVLSFSETDLFARLTMRIIC